MKKLAFFVTVFVVLILITLSGFAQDKEINGQIVTFDSIPVINAIIKVKSSKQVVKSDDNGKFAVKCASNEILSISAGGFYSEKVKVEKPQVSVNINLRLKPGNKNLKTAIDNGHVSNAERFNAIASAQQNEEDFTRYNNIYEIIHDKFPGVQISNGYIIIRGTTRMFVSAAENGALIVVDGVINDNSILSTLPTSQVKSIKILKDGSNAIYGSRGTNGVVLIETKNVVNN